MEEINTSNAYAGAGGPREEYSSIENVIRKNKFKRKIVKDLVPEVKRVSTKTCIGSLKFLFWGEEFSKQSVSIKAGKGFEEAFKFAIRDIEENFSLVDCGKPGKDGDCPHEIDLCFQNERKIYYFELKANIDLDTEKLPATCIKVQNVHKYLETKFPGFEIISGVLNWSVFDKEDCIKNKTNKSKLKKFNSRETKVIFFNDFCKIIDINFSKEEFYSFFREVGDLLRR